MKYNDYLLKSKEMNQMISLYKKEITELNRLKETPEIIKLKNLKEELAMLEKELINFNSNIVNLVNYNIDNDLKKEYLKEKPFNTAKADLPTFVALDEYENILGKPVYNFSLEERDELMLMKFKNTTIGAINSTASRINNYINFCIRKGKVPHNQNIFATFIKSEAQKFVSKQASNFRFITKDNLEEYMNKLVNLQDKLLLLLPYIGVRGRTVKGGTLEELINLELIPNSRDTKNNILVLKRNDGLQRDVYVTTEIMNLCLETYYTDEYYPNNETKEKCLKIYKINRYKNYVFCAIGSNKYDKLNPITINARLQKIQNYCGNQFITINNLYMSGMINVAIDIYKTKGEITNLDYIDICKQYKYGDDKPERYFPKLKYEVEKIYLQGV